MPKLLVFVKILILVSLLVLVLNFIGGEKTTVSGETLWVDDGYNHPDHSDGTISKPFKNIQSAIDAAENGDTIKVLQGTYNGDLTINKALTLTAENNENTVIRGNSKTSYLIDITSNNVTLENFKIWEYTSTTHRKAVVHISSNINQTAIVGNWINESQCGYFIKAENTHDIIIKDNKIENTKGIYLKRSNINCFTNNTICKSKNSNGIFLEHCNHNIIEYNHIFDNNYGVSFKEAKNNKIYNNTIYLNSIAGIKIDRGGKNRIKNNTFYENTISLDIDSQNNFFEENQINQSVIGLKITNDYNIIKDNIFTNSSSYDIFCEKVSSNNTIFSNILKNKTGMLHAKDTGQNQWYNKSTLEGNYWDDFYGPDPEYENNLETLNKSDFYYSKGGVLDKYPTGVFQKPPILKNPYPIDLSTNIDPNPSLSIEIFDPEEERLDVYFYQIKDNNSKLISKIENVESGRNLTIKLFEPGTYIGEGYDFICEWYVVAKDKYSKNQTENLIFTTSNVPINNIPPTININESYFGTINKCVVFNGNQSYDGDGEIIFYRWNFGDGDSTTGSLETSHIYKNPGEYTGSLTLVDDNGSTVKKSFKVFVSYECQKSESSEKLRCAIKITKPKTNYNTGKTISIISEIKGGFPPYNLTWKINNENFYNSKNISFKPKKPGTYIINFTVFDKFGNTANETMSINVSLANNEKIENPKKENIPGFETLLLIFSIILICIVSMIYKKRK